MPPPKQAWLFKKVQLAKAQLEIAGVTLIRESTKTEVEKTDAANTKERTVQSGRTGAKGLTGDKPVKQAPVGLEDQSPTYSLM